MWQLQPGILSRAALDAVASTALSIGGTPVTTATVGVAYTGFTATATGGTAPYTYSIASGALPAGITLNSSSGAVSGTPTTSGTYASIVVRAIDAVSATADLASFTITVAGTPATDFLARTSGLDATHVNAYTALINGLVADGVWSKLDVLRVHATQNSATALLNLVSSSYAGVIFGSPTFTADRGFSATNLATSVSNFIDSTFIPSTASSPKFTRDNAHISAWNLTNATSVGAAIGCNGSSGGFSHIHPKFTDNNAYFRINGGNTAGFAMTDARGHLIANRSASNAVQGYKNGSSVLTNSDASLAVSNVKFAEIANNNNGVTNNGTADQIAAISIGSSLTAGDATNFYNRLRTYMTAMGIP